MTGASTAAGQERAKSKRKQPLPKATRTRVASYSPNTIIGAGSQSTLKKACRARRACVCLSSICGALTDTTIVTPYIILDAGFVTCVVYLANWALLYVVLIRYQISGQAQLSA